MNIIFFFFFLVLNIVLLTLLSIWLDGNALVQFVETDIKKI